MTIRFLRVLCLLLLLFQITVMAGAREEERLSFSVPRAPWSLTLAKGNLTATPEQVKPDGSAGYFSLTDKDQGLNVSFFIEPVDKCNDSKSCRDMIWKLGNPAWEKPQKVVKSEIGEISYLEFFVPSLRGMAVKQQNMYVEYVVDGYWVDLHISKILYTPDDRKLFDDLIKSIKFEAKTK